VGQAPELRWAHRQFPLTMMTIRSAFIALLALCAACSVSNDQEVAIGKQDSDQINAQLPLVTDPAVIGYVDRLGQAIASKTSRADLAWHFYVVNTGEVNAFALPGASSTSTED
jgi:predicted Zn-dependent protease